MIAPAEDRAPTDAVEQWVASRLLAGTSHQAVLDHLVSIGFTDGAARGLVGAVVRSATYQVAEPLIERKRKLERLLLMLGGLWGRSPEAGRLPEVASIDAEGFQRSVASNMPVVIRGGAASWPALESWSPQRLVDDFGDAPVEFLAGDREVDLPSELAERTRTTTLRAFVNDVVSRPLSNEMYIVARNFSFAQEALRPLLEDVRPLDFIDLGPQWWTFARLWFGPRGTLTPLHHDLMPNVFVQVVGQKRFVMVHPAFTPLIPNPRGVYSDSDPLTWKLQEELAAVPLYDLTLSPGDILYIPPAWWHWVYACSVSISLSITGFKIDGIRVEWRNTGVSPLVGSAAPSGAMRLRAQGP